MKLSAQCGLHHALNIAQSSPRDIYRPDFRKSQTTGAIHDSLQTLRDSSPYVDVDAIAGTKNIVRPGGKIHRQRIKISGPIAENISAEMFQYCWTRRHLRIQVVQRWNIGVRIGMTSNLRAIKVQVFGRRKLTSRICEF